MAVTATRPRRLTALERTSMTPEQELERLIAEQEADDTHYVDSRGSQVSLDAPWAGGTVGSEVIGRDPWELVDDAVDLGLDPTELAFRGSLADLRPHRSAFANTGETIHGTANAYTNQKCRCEVCSAAWAKYMREYRASRKAAA